MRILLYAVKNDGEYKMGQRGNSEHPGIREFHLMKELELEDEG